MKELEERDRTECLPIRRASERPLREFSTGRAHVRCLCLLVKFRHQSSVCVRVCDEDSLSGCSFFFRAVKYMSAVLCMCVRDF